MLQLSYGNICQMQKWLKESDGYIFEIRFIHIGQIYE